MDTKERIAQFLNKLNIHPGEGELRAGLDDFTRFVNRIAELDDLMQLLPSPNRILQLSGGAGVFGLWVAQEFPDAEVVIVGDNLDFMEGGKERARQVGVNNIAFVAHTNKEWAGLAEGDFDVVISLLAIDTAGIVAPRTHSIAEAYHAGFEVDAKVTSAVNAMAKSLAPYGVALVTMKFKCGWAAVHFFEAVRNAGLGIEWVHSFKLLPTYRSSCLIVRKGGPHWFSNGLDDAISFHVAEEGWNEDVDKFDFTGLAADLMIAKTSDGEVLYQVKSATRDGIEVLETATVWNGLCLETKTATDGYHSHCNVVPAEILKHYWWYETGTPTHDGKELANVEITVTPRFQQLLDYYGEKRREDE